MEWYQILQAVLSLVFVVGLLLLCLWLFKFCEQKSLKLQFSRLQKNNRHIHIIEKYMLDTKNKIVLLCCDDIDYLLLLSPTHTQVLSQKPHTENNNHE
ncbi:MAG: hypothetical protein E7012_00845 [Alphaproteobacteria bacterium]|nr:hypothetical protein [Alphaproteobacteria bacterium]